MPRCLFRYYKNWGTLIFETPIHQKQEKSMWQKSLNHQMIQKKKLTSTWALLLSCHLSVSASISFVINFISSPDFAIFSCSSTSSRTDFTGLEVVPCFWKVYQVFHRVLSREKREISLEDSIPTWYWKNGDLLPFVQVSGTKILIPSDPNPFWNIYNVPWVVEVREKGRIFFIDCKCFKYLFLYVGPLSTCEYYGIWKVCSRHFL